MPTITTNGLGEYSTTNRFDELEDAFDANDEKTTARFEDLEKSVSDNENTIMRKLRCHSNDLKTLKKKSGKIQNEVMTVNSNVAAMKSSMDKMLDHNDENYEELYRMIDDKLRDTKSEVYKIGLRIDKLFKDLNDLKNTMIYLFFAQFLVTVIAIVLVHFIF